MNINEQFSQSQMDYAKWAQQRGGLGSGTYFPLISKTSSFSIMVGRLLCKDMRSILESEQFGGRKINWLESKGWFERLFTVTGEAQDVWLTAERIAAWARNVNICDYH